MSFLKNIRIAKKIGGGFGAVLLLLLIIGGVGFISLQDVGSMFNDYRGLARQTNEYGRIQANLLMTRMGVKDFIIQGDKAAITSVRERAKATEQIIVGTRKLTTDDTDLAVISEMEKELKAYQGAFDKVVAFQAERNKLVATLDGYGPQLERKVTEIMNSAYADGDSQSAFETAQVLRELLLARLYVIKFLESNAQAAYERATKEFAGFTETAQKMYGGLQNPARKALAKEVLEIAKSYIEHLHEVNKTINDRNAVISGTLDVIGPKVADVTESEKLKIKGLQDELGPRAVASISTTQTVVAIVAIVAVLLGIAAAYLIGTGITRPVGAMTAAMARLAEKDMGVEIPGTDHKDEVGDMAHAVQVFKDNMIEADRLAAEQRAEELKQAERAKQIENLCSAFDLSSSAAVKAVAAASGQLQSSATAMSSVAEQTSRQSTAVAAASEQASSNVQTVASAAEELSTSISEITRQVAQSSTISSGAVRQAKDTNIKVQGLADAANKIGEVVSLITDIAEQTNLLALNATIEAARAGDAGKGFAVVASEVKNLANQTAKATEEIAAQIGGVQASTKEAVAAIEMITKTIEEVDAIASTIASAVEEQSAATQEIARNVEQAAAGTQEVSSNISGVTQAANETGGAATEIQDASIELSHQSESLKVAVETFLSQVKAA
jgi:methyl-accepting chemotaxis protein